jgi:hypothetical protein
MTASCGPTITVEKINELLAKETPAGSTTARVIDFLDRQNIEHSEVLEHPQDESDFRDLLLRDDVVKTYIVAIIRDVERVGVTKWDIQMYFYFDTTGTLVRTSVKKVGTSF